jgi:uroporphyrinogen decarboxylase
MRYGSPDRVPYFEEGIRKEVLREWRKQGLPKDADIAQLYPSDQREVIEVDLEPQPKFNKWPRSRSDLKELFQRLLPYGRGRLPRGWAKRVRSWKNRDYPLMLRIHRGFFLSMGVYDWSRFSELMDLLIDDPEFVREAMTIQGKFAAGLAERVLKDVVVDAALFSEPIGGNYGPLISPHDVLHKYKVETIVLVTYANARALIPSMLKWGFNCLWACEVNIEEMDYRNIRQEFGRELRLIGGIDLDALRRDKDTIRSEIEEKVPPLVADGGYVPLADGRIRSDVPYENYVYYRELLQKVTQQ